MLQVIDVDYPEVLGGKSNGKLPLSILVETPGLSGGPRILLVPTATRCWLALTAAASAAGIVLNATSAADSYRSYRQQVDTFTSRYQVDPTTNGWKWWDSDNSGTPERWYKKDGVATAAVPGTSNHGWAIAVDIANASGSRLRWLEANAVKYGWSWETVPEEPWHIRNVTGDDIPAAVLAYEEDALTPEEHRMLTNEDRQLTADLNDQDTVTQINGTLSFPNHNRNRLVTIEGEVRNIQLKLDQVLAALSGGATPTGPVDLTPGAVENVAEKVASELSERLTG